MLWELVGYVAILGMWACQWASSSINRGCVDNLSLQFVTKWDSPNGERKLVTGNGIWLLGLFLLNGFIRSPLNLARFVYIRPQCLGVGLRNSL